MKRSIGVIVIVLVIVVGVVSLSTTPPQTEQSQNAKRPTVVPSAVMQKETTVTYVGKAGIDALTLLKESNTAEQNASGLVTTINGRKADDGKHEYWAFYVNGAMASVGPAEYVTNDRDTIVWKVERY